MKDLLALCSSLFWRVTSFDRCSNNCPGLTFGNRGLFLAPPCFNQLVVFFGVTGLFVFFCFLWFCLATFLTFAGLQLEVLLSAFAFFVFDSWVGCDLFAALNCFASSKQKFLIFSWFLLYSPTVLQAVLVLVVPLLFLVFVFVQLQWLSSFFLLMCFF